MFYSWDAAEPKKKSIIYITPFGIYWSCYPGIDTLSWYISSFGISCQILSNRRIKPGKSRDDLMCIFNRFHTCSNGEKNTNLVREGIIRHARRQSVEMTVMCGHYPTVIYDRDALQGIGINRGVEYRQRSAVL